MDKKVKVTPRRDRTTASARSRPIDYINETMYWSDSLENLLEDPRVQKAMLSNNKRLFRCKDHLIYMVPVEARSAFCPKEDFFNKRRHCILERNPTD